MRTLQQLIDDELDAARERRLAQEDCPHTDKDHSICLECGKDCFDDDIAEAEDAADAAQDRAWGL